jgi:hypothetical protein
MGSDGVGRVGKARTGPTGREKMDLGGMVPEVGAVSTCMETCSADMAQGGGAEY